MADNYTTDPGSGGNDYASDDVGGIHYPLVKITLGAMDANDGPVSAANPLPVTGTITAVTDITNTVTVGGTITEDNSGAIKTAVELIDDMIESDGSGTVAVGAVVLGKDGTTPRAIHVTATGEVEVVSNAAAIATQATLANLDGNVTACNTGAVVVASGAITETNSGDIKTAVESIDTKTPALGQAAMAASVPVTLASDQSDVKVTLDSETVEVVQGTATNLKVDGSDVTQPVSGAVTLSGSANEVRVTDGTDTLEILQNLNDVNGGHHGIMILGECSASTPFIIDGNVASLSIEQSTGGLRTFSANPAGLGAYVRPGTSTNWDTNLENLNSQPIAVNAGNADNGTQRVVLATDQVAIEVVQDTPADLNMTEVNSGDIKTAVELIDDAISGSEMQVDVVAPLPAGTNNIGDVDVLTLPDSIDGPGAPTVDSYTTDDINLAAATANQSVVSAPGASKQIWVFGIALSAAAAASVSIQDEDDTALSGVMEIAETGGFVINPSGNFAMPWIKVATNKALEIDTLGAGGTFDGIITYAIVSV